MYVCVCNAVTDRDIRNAAHKGTRTMKELSEQLRVATCCGKCAQCANKVLRQAICEQ